MRATYTSLSAFLASFLLCACVGISTPAAGHELTFGAQVRLRFEFQDNVNQKYYGDDPSRRSSNDGFLLGRFRAGFDYRPTEKIHLALWMQDSEVWDIALADRVFYVKAFAMNHNPNKDRWELWDGYLEIKDIFDCPLTFKGGRQRIFYGDNRIFGPGEWGNTGRWIWDAAKLSYTVQGGFLDIYYGRTQLHEPGKFSFNHRHGFESFGCYGRLEIPVSFCNMFLEPFVMTKNDEHTRYKGEDLRAGDLNSYYAGLRCFGNDNKRFDYDLTYILQRGDFAQDNIEAYGYHVLLAYTFNAVRLKPRISVEYTFGSGDSDPNDGDHETFDGAFGARDKMYGRMNLFNWKNLKDAQINLELNPKKWVFVKAELHKFWLAEKKDAWYLNPQRYQDKAGLSGNEVGMEFDVVARCELPKGHQIQLGFGHFWPDAFAKATASNKQANWLFLQWVYELSLNKKIG